MHRPVPLLENEIENPLGPFDHLIQTRRLSNSNNKEGAIPEKIFSRTPNPKVKGLINILNLPGN